MANIPARQTPAYRQFRRARHPNDDPPKGGRFRRDTTDTTGRPQPPGGFSYGTTIMGGPLFSDAFGARRAPSPWQLVEKYKSLVFAMVARKRDGVSKVPLRMFADNSRRLLGKIRSACDPIKVPVRRAMEHARSNNISQGAVDDIFEIRNHPFLDVLDNPDPYGYFSREKLIGLMVAFQDVVGQGFLVPEGKLWGDWLNPKKKGPPEFLWVLYPQYVIPFRDAGSNLIRFWQYFEDTIPFDSTIWFRQSISLRDAYGTTYSPAYAGDQYANQEDRFMSIFDQVLGLGPRPSLIATAKDPLQPPGEAERKRFEQDMQRRQSGGNAGNILVLNGAYDITPVSYSPADLAGMQVSEYDRTNLAAIFGLPPTYFTTETNLANLEAADAYFARFGVEPMCRSIANTLTKVVRQWDSRLYFAFDPVLAEDELKLAQVNKIYWDMGCRTANQINEEMKYPPSDWGAEPLFPKTLQTWSQMQAAFEQQTEAHEQGLEQGATGIEAQKASIENESKMTDFQTTPETEEEIAEERALAARLASASRPWLPAYPGQQRVTG